MNEFRFTCKRDVIHPALHGIDLDPLATKATRARLFFSLVIHATRPSLRNETLVGTAPPVIHGDFLLHPFSSTFDVIVGNPPYVMEVRGNQDVFRVYSKAPGIAPYYGQKIDVFYLFMFKALDLLVPGGIMAFIVQEYWLDRHHARRLRRRVFEHACTDVISFKEFTVFSSAPGHHSMITTIKKVPPAGELTTITTIIDGKVPTITLLRDLCKGAGNAIQQRVVDAATVYDPVLDKVFAGATNEQSLFAALQVMPSIHLDPDEIQLGINIPQARTRDGAGDERGIFVLDAGEVARLDPTPDEQALLRPFHPATSIQPFSFDMTGGACIIYSTNEVKRAMEADPACYPALARHLESHRDIITSDHGPYGLHRSRQPAWFESPVKIVGVRKTRSPRFAVVPVPWYMDQSGIYIVLREDEQRGLTPGYACAFLNSTTGARILRALRAQGDQLQVDKSVLLKVPFPVVPRWLVDGIDATSTWIHALHATGVSSHASLAARCKQAVDATFQHVVEHGTKALSGLKPVLATLPRVHMTAFTRIETPLPGYPGITRGTIDVDGLRDMVSLHAGTIEQVVVAMEGTARHASSRSSCQTN